MEKVLLGIIVSVLPSHAITVVQALLDFIYLLQLQMQTSKTLNALEQCLKMFHENKKIIIDLKIREHTKNACNNALCGMHMCSWIC